MLLGKTLIPELLETYSVLPNIAALKQDTTLCELVNQFEPEFNLMYKFKEIETSNDPLNALRDFTKDFILTGPSLDVPTIILFVDKVNNKLPKIYSDTIKPELSNAFDIANTIKVPKTKPNKSNVPLDKDDGFLNKLADALNQCTAPCNYFQTISDTLATLSNVGESNTPHTTALWDTLFEFFPPPISTTLNIYNKVSSIIKTEVMKTQASAESIFRSGLSPNFSEERIKFEQQQLQSGQTLEDTSESAPMTNAISHYNMISQSGPSVLDKTAKPLKDCYRIADYYKRFNYQDPQMNFGKARRILYNTNINGYTVVTDINGNNVRPYIIPEELTDLSNSSIDPQGRRFDDTSNVNSNRVPLNPPDPYSSPTTNPNPQN